MSDIPFAMAVVERLCRAMNCEAQTFAGSESFPIYKLRHFLMNGLDTGQYAEHS